MVTCPECGKGPNYKRQGWFVNHMTKEHDWTTSEAKSRWTSSVCYNCGKEILNPIVCIYCGAPLDVRLRELTK